jgi:superfamily II DNA/RNA helicase
LCRNREAIFSRDHTRSLSQAAAAAQDVQNQETSDHKGEWKGDVGHEIWFGLHAGLRKAVNDMGIKVPSEIQNKALPEISKQNNPAIDVHLIECVCSQQSICLLVNKHRRI